jgi:chromosome segregation ATPase
VDHIDVTLADLEGTVNSRNDFIDFVRDNDRRRHDDSKVQGLQQQIDELRQGMREIVSRHARLEEHLKTSESAAAQDRIALDQHRHEVSQAAQARQLDEARVRQQLSELSTRIDDATKPIRTLQAHVSELIDTVRKFRDEDTDVDHRIEELRTSIDHVAAYSERQVVINQAHRDAVDTMRNEIERVQREMHRTDDSVKIVEHDVRRRVAEVQQEVRSLETRFEDHSGLWQSLQIQIDEAREYARQFPPQIEAIDVVIERIEEHITAFNVQAKERDELTAHRIEEVREAIEVEQRQSHEIEELRHQRLEQRFEELEQIDRELSYRINMFEMQLDEFRQEDDRMRRELWYLHEQRVRIRLEQVQAELESVRESRREAERRMERSRDRDQEDER